MFISFPVLAIPPHENFQETDEDLYAIVEFLTDTKMLCEESLEHSLMGNCTIDFNQTVEILYSQDSLDSSLEKSKELEDKLSYSSDVLGRIKDKAGSYDYLKDFLLPIKDLGFNVSFFVEDHSKIIDNLSTIVGFIASGGNETQAMQSLADARSLVYLSRSTLQKIESNIEGINGSFSTADLKTLVLKLNQMLGTYDTYLATLLNLLHSDEPFLYIYVIESDVYIGEDVQVYGFFMADRNFVASHSVDVYLEDDVINRTYTDVDGRFECIIPMSLDYNPTSYNVSATSAYNSTVYYSNVILVTVHKIPTNLTFSVPKIHFYLNESIHFSGRLFDYKNRSISADISLHFAGLDISLKSGGDGSFNYVFNETLSFGKYSAFVSFNSEQVYKACKSKIVNISIDTPTVLTIFSSNDEIFIGEEIKLNGRLTSKIDNSPLSDKTIEIFLDKKNIGSANINNTGFYNFTYSTETLREGTHSIYSTFNSDDVEWRSTSSNVIKINLLRNILQHFDFATIVIIAGFIITTSFAFYFRKRIIDFLKTRKASAELAASRSANSYSSLSKKYLFDKKEFATKASMDKKEDFKDTIISRYRLLLRFLSSKGVTLTPNHTHLEIRDKMIKRNLPKKAIDNVTQTFELAMYSLYPISKEDVTLFDKNVFSILTNFGE